MNRRERRAAANKIKPPPTSRTCACCAPRKDGVGKHQAVNPGSGADEVMAGDRATAAR